MAPVRRLVWSPRSIVDVQEVWRYFARVASVEIADRLLRDIDAAARNLLSQPFQWRSRDELMQGLRAALVHPYTVFYRVKPDAIEIVRVLHERRNFPDVLSNSGR